MQIKTKYDVDEEIFIVDKCNDKLTIELSIIREIKITKDKENCEIAYLCSDTHYHYEDEIYPYNDIIKFYYQFIDY